jgi:hypothetical protein
MEATVGGDAVGFDGEFRIGTPRFDLRGRSLPGGSAAPTPCEDLQGDADLENVLR